MERPSSRRDPAGGFGTAFKLIWGSNEIVLHSFAGTPDGEDPYAGILAANSFGNLYGATLYGGNEGGYGTVFRSQSLRQADVLHSFASNPGWSKSLQHAHRRSLRQRLRHNSLWRLGRADTEQYGN